MKYKPRMDFPDKLKRICESLLNPAIQEDGLLSWDPRVATDVRLMPGMDQTAGRIFMWLVRRGVLEKIKTDTIRYVVQEESVLREILQSLPSDEADFIDKLQELTPTN